ncbi:MAG TPA: pyrroloquinoline quinone precursor peptide PqqA [Acetobacteraceae bacterium]|nr:pyrroloquinoline quinone precursor peptide PqqA [Acetobacteraceae bacterium]
MRGKQGSRQPRNPALVRALTRAAQAQHARAQAGEDARPEEDAMAWKKPRVTEISVAMEINCYACAEA